MRVLVVYFSYSGTTKKIANMIAELTNGEEHELVPEKQYDASRGALIKEAGQEIKNGFCPKLLSGDVAAEEYDCIFVGSPNWMGTFAPPVLTFLRNANLKQKRVALFCTHGGGGFGNMEGDMAKECAGAVLLPGGAFTAQTTLEQVKAWLEEIGWKKPEKQ